MDNRLDRIFWTLHQGAVEQPAVFDGLGIQLDGLPGVFYRFGVASAGVEVSGEGPIEDGRGGVPADGSVEGLNGGFSAAGHFRNFGVDEIG